MVSATMCTTRGIAFDYSVCHNSLFTGFLQTLIIAKQSDIFALTIPFNIRI